MNKLDRLLLPAQPNMSINDLKPEKAIKDAYKVSFRSKKAALLKLIPITFEVYEEVKTIKGVELKESIKLLVNDPNYEALSQLELDNDKEYKVSAYKLRDWDHKPILNKIKDQQGLNNYLAWLKKNNELINQQHPDILRQKLNSLGLVSLI